jgi:hypothetical protein
MLKRFYWLVLLVGGCLLIATSTSAQSSITASVKNLGTESFPLMSLSFEAHDANGAFIHGLQASELQITEDDQPVQIVGFKEMRPGVMLTVVLNPGESFTIRNSQGYSRYDLLLEALVNWSRTRLGSTIDDLSITVTGGPERTHISNPFDLFYALSNYKLDEQAAIPSLDTLFRAVEISSDPAPRMGMERDILLITSPMQGDLSFNIQNLLSQAGQKNIHFFVWFVTSQENFDPDTAYSFTELVNQTGGSFFTFTGSETIPSLESYLEPQRSLYQLSYDSELKTGGNHNVLVTLIHSGQTVRTQPQEFNIDLQPPDPAFISPQLKIHRKPASFGTQNSTANSTVFQPTSQEINILVDFPDGRVRDISHSALYVDGSLVDENQLPPFDQFTWDLSSYDRSGQHVLQGEVTDSLGITGRTIETPVLIEVDQPVTSYLTKISEHLPLITSVVVTVVIVLGLFLLILGGKIQPKSPFKGRSGKRSRKKQELHTFLTSKTKAVDDDRSHIPGWMQPWQRFEHKIIPQAEAYLTRIIENEATAPSAAIPLAANELTIGSDPKQATLVLDDPAIEKLHARLVRVADGSYRIMDEGSIAGTWVNFEPVTKIGVSLKHADLIHFGTIGFHFTLREPQPIPKPVITFDIDK